MFLIEEYGVPYASGQFSIFRIMAMARNNAISLILKDQFSSRRLRRQSQLRGVGRGVQSQLWRGGAFSQEEGLWRY